MIAAHEKMHNKLGISAYLSSSLVNITFITAVLIAVSKVLKLKLTENSPKFLKDFFKLDYWVQLIFMVACASFLVLFISGVLLAGVEIFEYKEQRRERNEADFQHRNSNGRRLFVLNPILALFMLPFIAALGVRKKSDVVQGLSHKRMRRNVVFACTPRVEKKSNKKLNVERRVSMFVAVSKLSDNLLSCLDQVVNKRCEEDFVCEWNDFRKALVKDILIKAHSDFFQTDEVQSIIDKHLGEIEKEKISIEVVVKVIRILNEELKELVSVTGAGYEGLDNIRSEFFNLQDCELKEILYNMSTVTANINFSLSHLSSFFERLVKPCWKDVKKTFKKEFDNKCQRFQEGCSELLILCANKLKEKSEFNLQKLQCNLKEIQELSSEQLKRVDEFRVLNGRGYWESLIVEVYGIFWKGYWEKGLKKLGEDKWKEYLSRVEWERQKEIQDRLRNKLKKNFLKENFSSVLCNELWNNLWKKYLKDEFDMNRIGNLQETLKEYWKQASKEMGDRLGDDFFEEICKVCEEEYKLDFLQEYINECDKQIGDELWNDEKNKLIVPKAFEDEEWNRTISKERKVRGKKIVKEIEDEVKCCYQEVKSMDCTPKLKKVLNVSAVVSSESCKLTTEL